MDKEVMPHDCIAVNGQKLPYLKESPEGFLQQAIDACRKDADSERNIGKERKVNEPNNPEIQAHGNMAGVLDKTAKRLEKTLQTLIRDLKDAAFTRTLNN